MPLAPYAPAIFVMDQATRQGAILDANYNLVGPSNPTTAGAYVQLYCTGLGPVTNQPATGAPALADPLSWTTAATTATEVSSQLVSIARTWRKVTFSSCLSIS